MVPKVSFEQHNENSDSIKIRKIGLPGRLVASVENSGFYFSLIKCHYLDIQSWWDRTPCPFVNIYRSFGKDYCVHLNNTFIFRYFLLEVNVLAV